MWTKQDRSRPHPARNGRAASESTDVAASESTDVAASELPGRQHPAGRAFSEPMARNADWQALSESLGLASDVSMCWVLADACLLLPFPVSLCRPPPASQAGHSSKLTPRPSEPTPSGPSRPLARRLPAARLSASGGPKPPRRLRGLRSVRGWRVRVSEILRRSTLSRARRGRPGPGRDLPLMFTD